MGTPSVQDLECAVSLALRLAGLSEVTARTRAEHLGEFLVTYGIDSFRIAYPDFLEACIGVVHYHIGSTGYSINKAKPSDGPVFPASSHGGTGLDCENLLLLLRVGEIARELIPDLWLRPNKEFRQQIRTPRQHLSTLNEVWWLSRWRGRPKIDREVPINPACNMGVDWRLTWNHGLGSQTIVNLEVKLRTGGDLTRLTSGSRLDPEEIFAAGLEDRDGNSKFRPSGPDEVNVLGLTLLGEIDREVQLSAKDWIHGREDVDVLLLFSRFSQSKSGFDRQIVRKQERLDGLLIHELDEIDLNLHRLILSPIDEEQKLLSEMP